VSTISAFPAGASGSSVAEVVEVVAVGAAVVVVSAGGAAVVVVAVDVVLVAAEVVVSVAALSSPPEQPVVARATASANTMKVRTVRRRLEAVFTSRTEPTGASQTFDALSPDEPPVDTQVPASGVGRRVALGRARGACTTS
jgi:hypothetical protein